MRLYIWCFDVLGVKVLWYVHYFIDPHHHRQKTTGERHDNTIERLSTLYIFGAYGASYIDFQGMCKEGLDCLRNARNSSTDCKDLQKCLATLY